MSSAAHSGTHTISHTTQIEAGPGGGRRAPSLRRTTGALVSAGTFRWAPLLAALAVDLADFATAGPLGLVAGLFVGALLTAVVSLSAGARPRRALALALLGGLYCALPLTEAVPFATLLTLLHTSLARGEKDEAATAEQ